MYPPKLPDLFQGTQLVVIGRYTGSGHAAIKLTGMVGSERKEFVYEVNFPARTESEAAKEFVEPLWARRKVGFLLDQIRANGEKKELVDEVTALAKRYGITTPYTSYLVVPDGPMPVVPPHRPPIGRPRPLTGPSVPGGPVFGFTPPGLAPSGGFGGAGGKPMPVDYFAREQAKGDANALASNRGLMYEREIKEAEGRLAGEKDAAKRIVLAKELQTYRDKKQTHDEANREFKGGRTGYQTGKLGVDLAENSCALRNQERLTLTANRRVNGRQVLEVGGVWIDDGFKAEMKTVVVKAQSDAYFQILDKHAAMKDVFHLGNHVVWVAPSGTALVLDLNDGKEKLTDAEIDALFAAK